MSKSKDQLALLQPSEGRWRIDSETREVGRRGLEQARQALAEARATGRSRGSLGMVSVQGALSGVMPSFSLSPEADVGGERPNYRCLPPVQQVASRLNSFTNRCACRVGSGMRYPRQAASVRRTALSRSILCPGDTNTGLTPFLVRTTLPTTLTTTEAGAAEVGHRLEFRLRNDEVRRLLRHARDHAEFSAFEGIGDQRLDAGDGDPSHARLHHLVDLLGIVENFELRIDPLIVVALIAAAITASEIAITLAVFQSPYNWFHLG